MTSQAAAPPPGAEPPDTSPLAQFVALFRRYINLMTLAVAALPLTLTGTGAVPSFAAQRGQLAVYTSLLSALVVAFLFSIRHFLARVLFPDQYAEAWLIGRWLRRWPVAAGGWRFLVAAFWHVAVPVLLIAVAARNAYHYAATLDVATVVARADLALQARQQPGDTALAGLRAALLASVDSGEAAASAHAERILTGVADPLPADSVRALYAQEVPFGQALFRSHVRLHMAAAAAFVLLALREFLQNVLALGEKDLVARKPWQGQPGG